MEFAGVVKELLTAMRAGVLRAVFAVALLTATHVAPAAVVDLCNRDDQPDEPGRTTNLVEALQQGGVITFNCRNVPARLLITRDHVITNDVSLEGGDASRLILDGARRAGTMFRIGSAGRSIRLSHLTVENANGFRSLGRSPVRPTSSVVLAEHAGDRVVLEALEVRNSYRPFAILNGASLSARNTRFFRNDGTVISSYGGSVDLRQSSFIGAPGFSVGVSVSGGRADIRERVSFTQFTFGAVSIGANSQVMLQDATFSANRGVRGGAVAISGSNSQVELRNVEFQQNTAVTHGGAVSIEPSGTAPVKVVMRYVAFSGNSAPQGGAVYLKNAGQGATLAISAARFIDNRAGEDGGALFVRQARGLVVANSLAKGNRARRGAAFFLIGDPGTQNTVANTLIAGNQAEGGPGAAFVGHEVSLVNVTVASNTGGGWGDGAGSVDLRDFVAGAPRVRLRNVVLADNAPSNCVGRLQGEDNGASLQSPASPGCPAVTFTAPAMLDPFFAPLPGSPVMSRGRLEDCMSAPVSGRDFLFQKRGTGGACSSGALEMAPLKQAETLRRRHSRQGHDH